KCAPFLERFFHAWDGMPSAAPLSEHVSWLRGFVADLGLAEQSRSWRRFWEEIEHWLERDTQAPHCRSLDRKTFQHHLHSLAAETGVARTARGPGRVRILSAPLARSLDADFVFLLGLGERSFPSLAAPSSLLEEAERQALRGEGIELVCLSDLLAQEMLL